MSIHKTLMKDFSFLSDYGFEVDAISRHAVFPAVYYKNKNAWIGVGYSYEYEENGFFVIIGTEGQLRGTSLISKEAADGKYKDQLSAVQKEVRKYLENNAILRADGKKTIKLAYAEIIHPTEVERINGRCGSTPLVIEHFSNDANYKAIRAKITYSRVVEVTGIRILHLDIDGQKLYDDYGILVESLGPYFVITAANEKLLNENGVFLKENDGVEYEFLTSLVSFGDVWVYPIAGITRLADEPKVLLDFKTGKENLLRDLAGPFKYLLQKKD